MKIEKDYPTPKLNPGSVLIKNKFSGINFIDTYHRSGLYKRDLPFIGGQEGGGFVAATSPEFKRAKAASGADPSSRYTVTSTTPERGSHSKVARRFGVSGASLARTTGPSFS